MGSSGYEKSPDCAGPEVQTWLRLLVGGAIALVGLAHWLFL
jgi:hypothetical protein